MLMQSGGLLLIYEVRQCFTQYEMLELINNSKKKQETFLLTPAEFKNKRINNHEIYIDGKLYDIVSKKHSEKNIQILAIHDSEEENIISNIKIAINRHTNQNKALPETITGMNTMLFIDQEALCFHFFFLSKDITYANYSLVLSSPLIDTTSPPPWIT